MCRTPYAVGVNIAIDPLMKIIHDKQVKIGATTPTTKVILFILFRKARLEKVITTNGVYYRWLPVQSKFRVIGKDIIKDASIRRAPSLNYGSNYVPGYGRIHAATKGDGVEILKEGGKKIFFSSDDPQALLKSVRELIASNSKTRTREF